MAMDMSQMNMNDPRVRAMMAEYMRQQGGGGGGAPGGMPPPAMPGPQMPPGGAPAQAVQAPLQAGPAPGGPMGAPQPPQGPQGPMPGPGGPPPGGPPPGDGGQLDPALVEGALSLGGQRGERQGLDRQYALADAMRANATQQTKARQMGSSTGGMTIAPGWGNAAVAIGQNLMAQRREGQADARGAVLDADRARVQKSYFDALTGQKKKRDPNADLGGWGSLSDL